MSELEAQSQTSDIVDSNRTLVKTAVNIDNHTEEMLSAAAKLDCEPCYESASDTTKVLSEQLLYSPHEIECFVLASRVEHEKEKFPRLQETWTTQEMHHCFALEDCNGLQQDASYLDGLGPDEFEHCQQQVNVTMYRTASVENGVFNFWHLFDMIRSGSENVANLCYSKIVRLEPWDAVWFQKLKAWSLQDTVCFLRRGLVKHGSGLLYFELPHIFKWLTASIIFYGDLSRLTVANCKNIAQRKRILPTVRSAGRPDSLSPGLSAAQCTPWPWPLSCSILSSIDLHILSHNFAAWAGRYTWRPSLLAKQHWLAHWPPF